MMPGPPPKDPAQRARSRTGNVPVGEWFTLPAEGFAGPVPELPDGYRPETGAWFATWARSPQAAAFTATDWNRLVHVIAPLFDRFVGEPTVSLAGELRLQEAALGATPADRLRLRWRIAERPESSGSVSRVSPSVAKRRAKLHAVDSEAA